MAPASACPISRELVDHNVNRVTCILTIMGLTAISTLAVVSDAFGTIAWVLAAALTLDYATRAWTRHSSPMQLLARELAGALGIPKKPSDRAPKRFACRIGFFFALGTVALLPFSAVAAAAVASVLLFFNVLDGVFDFCVGCWMYSTFVLPRSATL